MRQLDSETLATQNITSALTVLTNTPSATVPTRCALSVALSGLDESGGTFSLYITIGGVPLQPYPMAVACGATATAIIQREFLCPANAEIVAQIMSPNAADTSVGIVATLWDTTPLQPATVGRQIGVESDGDLTKVNALDGHTPQTGDVYAQLPTNFSDLSISETTGRVDVGSIAGSARAASALAARNYEYGTASSVIVAVTDAMTDEERGTALLAAYTAAKALTPNGAALSATNRACVLIPEAWYLVATGMTLDAEYVDLCAMNPRRGGWRRHTDADNSFTTAGFRPPPTVVYSTTYSGPTVTQSAADIQLRGFAIVNLKASDNNASGLYVSLATDAGNKLSRYHQMYLWASSGSIDYSKSVKFAKHVDGTWTECISNWYGWRCGSAGSFRATMRDCEGGFMSFIGDDGTLTPATGCDLRRVRAIGTDGTFPSGYGSFGGCFYRGMPIDSTCYFEDCEMGNNSGGLGVENAGTWVNCRGGKNCLGGTCHPTMHGTFSGVCIGGKYGAGSVGGEDASYTGLGRLTGKAIGVVVLDNENAHNIEGAVVEGCTFIVTTPDKDGFKLIDSSSKIHDTTIVVSGTGIPINAASALSVSAVGNRYSNGTAAGQVNGLGSNVTNIGNPATVTTDSASREASKATEVGLIDNAITAAKIAASALNGKGDWNVGKTGYALTTAPPTAAQIKAAMEAEGGHLALILADTGTDIPATLATISGYVDCLPESWVVPPAGSDWTPTRAGYVDKLNVSGTLAHSDAAATYKADVSGLATSVEVAAVQTHGDSNWATATGFSTHSAADVKAAMEAEGSLLKETHVAATETIPTAIGEIEATVDEEALATAVASAVGEGIADEVWSNENRTLTGSSSTVGPTSATEVNDIYTTAHKNGTRRLDARVRNWDGDDILQADISSIAYTAYLLDASNPDARTAITGHSAVSLTVADVIFDTLQTDEYSSNFNFSHTPPIGTTNLFTIAGRDYLIEYTITPTSGEKIIVRFRVACK